MGGPNETVETAIAEAQAAALASDMTVTTSAVGIQITEANAAELREVAQAGGGVYVSAANADQIAAALEQAVSGTVVTGGPGSVALIPPAVFQAAPENGVLMAEALQAELIRAGLKPLHGSTVQAEIARRMINPKFPIPLMRLAALGRELQAEYVVYPRVLSVGRPFNAKGPDEYVINVLVNVVQVKTGRILHTYQATTDFKGPDRKPDLVVTPALARLVAARLLQGFLAKLKTSGP